MPELIGGGGLYAPVAGRLLVALPVDRMAPGVAFGGVAVAVWLTFRTLGRSTSLYRPPNLRSMFAARRPATGVRS